MSVTNRTLYLEMYSAYPNSFIPLAILYQSFKMQYGSFVVQILVHIGMITSNRTNSLTIFTEQVTSEDIVADATAAINIAHHSLKYTAVIIVLPARMEYFSLIKVIHMAWPEKYSLSETRWTEMNTPEFV